MTWNHFVQPTPAEVRRCLTRNAVNALCYIRQGREPWPSDRAALRQLGELLWTVRALALTQPMGWELLTREQTESLKQLMPRDQADFDVMSDNDRAFAQSLSEYILNYPEQHRLPLARSLKVLAETADDFVGLGRGVSVASLARPLDQLIYFAEQLRDYVKQHPSVTTACRTPRYAT